MNVQKFIFFVAVWMLPFICTQAFAQDSTLKKTDSVALRKDTANNLPGTLIVQDSTNRLAADSVVEMKKTKHRKAVPGAVYYGVASYYADKFNGRRTAYAETFNQRKYTAACNILPLGTWIRVTNIKNGRTIDVKINDHIHPRMKRIVDLSKSAAQKLGFIASGITKVKVEVLR